MTDLISGSRSQKRVEEAPWRSTRMHKQAHARPDRRALPTADCRGGARLEFALGEVLVRRVELSCYSVPRRNMTTRGVLCILGRSIPELGQAKKCKRQVEARTGGLQAERRDSQWCARESMEYHVAPWSSCGPTACTRHGARGVRALVEARELQRLAAAEVALGPVRLQRDLGASSRDQTRLWTNGEWSRCLILHRA